MHSKTKRILYIISLLCILYGIGTAAFTLTATGSMVIIFLGVLLLLHTCFYEKIQVLRKQSKWKKIYGLSTMVVGIFGITFLIHTITITQASLAKPNKQADAIIVLGAGLIGEDVSLSLASRLDTAAAYYMEYPDTILLVSGGQGENEIVTEAYAMSNYLQNTYDIPSDSILLEESSTRTTENFAYSKHLLDLYFDTEYDVIYITNDFHLYRSGMIAEISGLDAQGLSAPSPWYLLPNYYVREYFAIIKYYLVDAPFWR